MNKNLTLLLLIPLILTTACTHSVKKPYTGQVRAVYMPNVENNTVRYELGDTLNTKLNDEILREPSLNISSKEEAKYDLFCTIIDYKQEPLTYSVDNRAEEYNIEIKVKIKFVNKTTNIVLLDKDMSGEERYFTSASSIQVSGKTDVELEKDAQQTALMYLSEDIIKELSKL